MSPSTRRRTDESGSSGFTVERVLRRAPPNRLNESLTHATPTDPVRGHSRTRPRELCVSPSPGPSTDGPRRSIGSFAQVRGGIPYPELIESEPKKPLRVFLSSDLRSQLGCRRAQLVQCQSASRSPPSQNAGYDRPALVLGDGGHDPNHGGAILPDHALHRRGGRGSSQDRLVRAHPWWRPVHRDVPLAVGNGTATFDSRQRLGTVPFVPRDHAAFAPGWPPRRLPLAPRVADQAGREGVRARVFSIVPPSRRFKTTC